MKPGRPFKGSSRRVPITIHAPAGMLDVIDAHVQDCNMDETQDGAPYSRSDFYNDAATALLRSRGVEVEEDQRTKNVPGDSDAGMTADNINNLEKSGGEKTAQATPNEPTIKEWE